MCVSPVSMFGGGGIDPLLAERYAILNEEIRQKRIEKQRGVNSLVGVVHPRVEPVKEPAMSLEEFRKMRENPLLSQVSIHIAYKIMQRICDNHEYYPQGHCGDVPRWRGEVAMKCGLGRG